jgi:hypothetical protein
MAGKPTDTFALVPSSTTTPTGRSNTSTGPHRTEHMRSVVQGHTRNACHRTDVAADADVRSDRASIRHRSEVARIAENPGSIGDGERTICANRDRTKSTLAGTEKGPVSAWRGRRLEFFRESGRSPVLHPMTLCAAINATIAVI